MQYLCEKTKNGRKISRVFGYDSIVEIPECLMGESVTELGDYVFSDRMGSKRTGRCVTQKEICVQRTKKPLKMWISFLKSQGQIWKSDPSAKYKKTGRYAFYNCRNLKKIFFGGALRDLGAGALTGCHQVSELTVRLGENDGSLSAGNPYRNTGNSLCQKIKKGSEGLLLVSGIF